MPRSRSQQKSDLSITRTEAGAIGARIRQLRGSEKAQDFARRIGIAREHLSRIESGVQVPGTETLRRLAQVSGASLDFVVLGGDSARRMESAAAGGGWEAGLAPLLAGTTLRLRRSSTASGRRAERAWPELSEERRDEVRMLVRRTALVAAAIETLMPARAAKAVVDELGDALTTLVVERIVAAGPRTRPLS
jgi:transcriptional regulator with XRE-family HTH domain